MRFETEVEREDFLADLESIRNQVHDLAMVFVDVTSEPDEQLWTRESMERAALVASTRAAEFLRIARERAERAGVAGSATAEGSACR